MINTILIILAIVFASVCLTFIAFLVTFFFTSKNSEEHKRPFFKLLRHHKNPVISPLPIREWELGGTFNPAAFKDDEGKVHLLYRAVGADGLSRVGYASSPDGFHFNDRSIYPVYEPTHGYGMPDPKDITGPHKYDPVFYASGGGWGGSEDPRTVEIEGRVYMSYVAFEGWNSVRIALTSISTEDLKKKRWNWRKPQMMSSPGTVSKNWVIFPEKINGKFAILHTITPDIKIDYIDSLDFITKHIVSPRLHGPQPGRKKYWDNRLRGAGPPPIKTKIGWLLLYHAQDIREPDKYKLGAMILDTNDPTRILYRSPQPILEPDAHYENDGKPGVVYASGAVIIGDNLMVYYGGGDKHVCIAETPLNGLLNWLVTYGKVS
ncbi:MAG: hypothetical protein WC648_01385 [Candidatus Paceibacterota bacterium]|jgi:predicted GH43/DUF377 family glycosyl hydrolase